MWGWVFWWIGLGVGVMVLSLALEYLLVQWMDRQHNKE